jgi:hypothetical protein
VAGAGAVDHPRLVDLQLEGVEHDLVDRSVDVDVDGDGAAEGGVVEVGRQLQFVARRGDVGGEPVRVQVACHGGRRYPLPVAATVWPSCRTC